MNALYRHPSSMPAAPSRLRVGNEGFVADATLDQWVRTGEGMRAGALLTAHDGARFVLRDAIRVLGRRDGDVDPYGLTGRADSIRDYLRNGAMISGNTLRLGNVVYDIEYGVVATRMLSADESGPLPRMG